MPSRRRSVTRNGVVFTPADIKGLLAEVYMYSHTQSLGGDDKEPINPAMLHLSLANWLGRQSHPVAMETALGEPVINFPIYAYKTTLTKLSPPQLGRENAGHLHAARAKEYDKAAQVEPAALFPLCARSRRQGKHRRGASTSATAAASTCSGPRCRSSQGGQEGNRGGNPHLDVKEVLAIWRESVEKSC